LSFAGLDVAAAGRVSCCVLKRGQARYLAAIFSTRDFPGRKQAEDSAAHISKVSF